LADCRYAQGEMKIGKPRHTTQFISEIEAFFVTDNYVGIYYDINRFKQFLIEFESQLSKTNQLILKDLSKVNLEVKLSMLKQPHIDNSINHFSHILRNNSFITIYAYLETKLFELTNLTKEHLPQKLNFQDYIKLQKRKRSKIVMMLSYFEEELQVEFDSKKEIGKIEDFRFIRDCIIHCNADISISRDKIKIEEIIKKAPELNSNYNLISFNSNDYIFKLGNLTIELFNELTSKLIIKYNSSKKPCA